jgi:hypothetical protein
MNTTVWIVIGIVVLAVIVLAAVVIVRQRSRARLQQRFGPEYERQVRARGSERDAAQHLSKVADRRDELDIRPLEPMARERYTRRWEVVQTHFVERPGPALDEADWLVMDVMHERGYPVYPVGHFDDRAELIAADHPQVVRHYRAARAARQGHHGHPEPSDTEHLRQAFMHYRVLFEELVRQDGKPVTATGQRPAEQTPPPLHTDRYAGTSNSTNGRSGMNTRHEQYGEDEQREGLSGRVRRFVYAEVSHFLDKRDRRAAAGHRSHPGDPDPAGPDRAKDSAYQHHRDQAAAGGMGRVGLLNDTVALREEWQRVQVTFVDDPGRAVHEASVLVDRMLEEIRANLPSGYTRDMSTEDLRVAFQRYREFFQRLLSA